MGGKRRLVLIHDSKCILNPNLKEKKKKRDPLTLPPLFFIFYPRLLLSSPLFRILSPFPFHSLFPFPSRHLFPFPPARGSRPQPHLPYPTPPFSQPLSFTPPRPHYYVVVVGAGGWGGGRVGGVGCGGVV